MTDASPDDPHSPAVCLDVGSGWTKAVLVLPDGTPAGFAEHPTTPDVLTGVDAAVAALHGCQLTPVVSVERR